MAVEDIIPKYKARRTGSDEVLTNDERLGKPFRAGLLGVLQLDLPLISVAKQLPVKRQILGGGNYQNLTDAGQHKGCKGIIHHRLVVNGENLLTYDLRDGIQSRSTAPGKDNTFQTHNRAFQLRCNHPDCNNKYELCQHAV
jgi:hypothetical protein